MAPRLPRAHTSHGRHKSSTNKLQSSTRQTDSRFTFDETVHCSREMHLQLVLQDLSLRCKFEPQSSENPETAQEKQINKNRNVKFKGTVPSRNVFSKHQNQCRSLQLHLLLKQMQRYNSLWDPSKNRRSKHNGTRNISSASFCLAANHNRIQGIPGRTTKTKLFKGRISNIFLPRHLFHAGF